MFYITGDIHGNVTDLKMRCINNNIKKEDTLIILGDFGANFFGPQKDSQFKKRANNIGPVFFSIHGNHEIRPQNIKSYKEKEWNGGTVYYEEKFPNLLFAKDGEIYNINGLRTFVCGGAYSVDKYNRAWRAEMRNLSNYEMLQKITNVLYKKIPYTKKEMDEINDFIDSIPSNTIYWWKDEQPSDETKEYCEKVLADNNHTIDVILTHTGPEKYEPVEMFLDGINQSIVDKTTEKWFDKIEEKTNYKKWYAGHYHINKAVNPKFQFLFENVEIFGI